MSHEIFDVHLLKMLLVLVTIAEVTSADDGTSPCEGIVAYRLEFGGQWSQEAFPKQYPTYRPPAQWSKLVGRTHSGQYVLWSDGQLSSSRFRQFAEKGSSDHLNSEPQGNLGIFDSFMAPSILSGVGRSIVKFLVHPSHPQLSFAVRMIPSPDWFVGVSSLNLCSDGSWIKYLQLNLDPMDAGTDRGLTYTSPSWPEKEIKNISKLTPTSPNHRASSFYYTEMEKLPTIAIVKLTKVQVPWNDMEDFENKSSQASVDKSKSDSRSVIEAGFVRDNEALSPSSDGLNQRRSRVGLVSQEIPTSSRTSKLKKVVIKKVDGRTDCEVSSWSGWGACSKSCGYGQQVRTRSVVRRSRSGGRPCPALREEQLCGTMRGCGWQHFKQDNWESPTSTPTP